MATTIYSETDDGDIYVTSSPGGSSWADARDATSGTATSNAIGNPTAVRAVIIVIGRGTHYSVSRAFFIFDVGRITHIPKSATISIKGSLYGDADMRLVKSNQAIHLQHTDFDAIEGWVAGADNRNNVTPYETGVIYTWNTLAYNVITLSQQALVDIAGLDYFKCCLIEYASDLRSTAPTAPSGVNNKSGVVYADAVGTSTDPKLLIKEQDDSVFFGANF